MLLENSTIMNTDKLVNTDKFFISINDPGDIPQEAYNNIEILVRAAKAFAQSTPNFIYIIDYFKRNFVYVSDNLLWLFGEPADKIQELSYQLYIKHVPEAEQDMLLKINNKGFEIFDTLPIAERTEYTIFYDFHIIKGRKKKLINHRLTPMALTPKGRIWLALCTISPSAHKTPGNVMLKRKGSQEYYRLNESFTSWEKCKEISLTDNERAVLLLSSQGYTMNEIADRLCKSVDAVKAYKKKLFERLEVSSITEAVTFAANYRLL